MAKTRVWIVEQGVEVGILNADGRTVLDSDGRALAVDAQGHLHIVWPQPNLLISSFCNPGRVMFPIEIAG